jgi:putative toxin-antitoxin system toxin component, PIN family
MALKIVLDTNIILSAILNGNGQPAKIFDLFLDKEASLYYSEAMIDEYKDVLSRERFKIPKEKVGRVINIIRKLGINIDPITSIFPMTDESDRIFHDTAENATAWLITGNIKHYPNKDFILTPSDFCKRLNL